MIRPINLEHDLARIIDIWYKSSIIAHFFIAEGYWLNAKSLMGNVYIPNSNTWVMLDNETIIGFYSLVDDNLAAIFVDPAYQGRGFGAKLLEHAILHANTLQLHVYQKNKKAIDFYVRHGFAVVSSCVDEGTGEDEYIMRRSR